ncbi:putative RNA-binding protein ARP1 [Silene latifolia]|uniref:putative RNA-binding protein ARP1 n=1 Tax=Silene latifolia TaxID=37657 RepID=UPI003D7822F6
MTMSNNVHHHHQQHGDTTLTKVFVGGLAWETLKEAMHDHFDQYGEILEAVIISDKISGRSKGYGFVTFKDPEAAKKACEDPTPIINGRRANCNLAALGARRPPRRSSSTTPPLQQRQPVSNGAGSAKALRGPTSCAAKVQWYYPAHQHHQALPFYPGCSPAYITAHDHVGYNHKVSFNSSGGYMNGHYTQMYAGGQAMVAGANTMMAMYPYYPYTHHHQQAAMGLPAAHFFPPSSSSAPITASSPIISKPTVALCTPPSTVCLTVE